MIYLRKAWVRLFILCLCSQSLTACISVLPSALPSSTIYKLDPTDRSWNNSPDATSIRIGKPIAPHILASKDIVASPDGQRYRVLSGAEWIEILPDMVQISLQDVINEDPKMIGVLPVSGAKTDYRLSLTIRDFEARFDNGNKSAPLIIVKYAVTLTQSSRRDLVGTYEVLATQRAQAASVSAVVEAMSQANNKALAEIVSWMNTRGLKS